MRFPRRSIIALAAALPLVTLPAGCGSSPGGKAGEDVERPPSSALFEEAASRVGLDFRHFTGAIGEYYMAEIMGSGVALFDYDLDGDLDVYFLQGALLGPSKDLGRARFPPPERHWPGNRLYRNELVPSGELRFTDVTDVSGLGHEGYGMGAAVGDYDNDGDPDLYVTNFGPNVLYRNNGDGTFAEVAAKGLDDPRWSTSAAFLDYDNDGDLDLFFANYIDFNVRNNKECFDPTGARDYCSPTAYRPVPDKLFRNDGAAGFHDVSLAAGLGTAYGNGLGVATADFNSDGRIDIYVANDGVANQLWLNSGKGTFENVALMAGAAYNADGRAEAGMGVTAGDFDGDGDEDLFMTHLALETNTLYLNNGRGEFRDATNQFGLGSVSTPDTGFGSRWFDCDNDSLLDLFVANGAVTIMESLRSEAYPFRQKNRLFRGLGRRFEDVSRAAGAHFEIAEVSRGAAFGDIDNDGDVDIVVSNNNGPARLLINQSQSQAGGANAWARVRLVGAKSNRDAYGARAALLRAGMQPLRRRVHADGSYCSSSEPTLHFGLGEAAEIEGVGVIWPSGRRELFRGVAARKPVTLREGEGEDWTPPAP